jgi:UDP-N-acetylglucosamine--N-acetylmuramyl-(pentapeptide) pyrophosphoryl-undecaprenol N-acetylglucosamine transferase
MLVLIAAGGTGGHIYPALAVARSLTTRPEPPDLRWVGGRRGLEARLVPPSGIPLRLLALRSLRSTDASVHLVLDPLRLAASFPEALALLARTRPAAVFTTGGYVAMPVLAAAATLRIPSLLWEGNVRPGRSVRATARFASALAVTHPETAAALARDGADARAYVTGTPIRDPATVDREAARDHLGIPPGPRVVLVFGGSQAVARFSAAVTGALPRLVEKVAVVHVTGEEAYAAALAAREALPAERRERYRPYPFLRDEMTAALAAADLVVGRAGASTLAEVAAFGVPMVVVPYPHAAGHQRANAAALVEAGAAVLVADEDFDADALLAATAILDDPRRHLDMSAAARALGRPGAAAAVAEVLLALAERRPLPEVAAVEAIAAGARP